MQSNGNKKIQFLSGSVILPKRIEVKIIKGKNTPYILEIPQYDISTEADSVWEIDDLISDLLLVYFDIPKKLRGFVRYVRRGSKETKKERLNNLGIPIPLVFQQFISPDVHRLYK